MFIGSGDLNSVILVKDSDTDGPSSVTVRMVYFICFSIHILCTLCGKPMRGRLGTFCYFCSLGVF